MNSQKLYTFEEMGEEARVEIATAKYMTMVAEHACTALRLWLEEIGREAGLDNKPSYSHINTLAAISAGRMVVATLGEMVASRDLAVAASNADLEKRRMAETLLTTERGLHSTTRRLLDSARHTIRSMEESAAKMMYQFINLKDSAKKVERERDEAVTGRGLWEETARQSAINADYYKGLLVVIGEMFGEEAKTQDDGVAKVPELVAKLKARGRPTTITPTGRERTEALKAAVIYNRHVGDCGLGDQCGLCAGLADTIFSAVEEYRVRTNSERVEDTPPPLCGDHAQVWFTQRNTIKTESGCVACDAQATIDKLRSDLQEFTTTLTCGHARGECLVCQRETRWRLLEKVAKVARKVLNENATNARTSVGAYNQLRESFAGLDKHDQDMALRDGYVANASQYQKEVL